MLSQICVTCDTEPDLIVRIFYHFPTIFSIGKMLFCSKIIVGRAGILAFSGLQAGDIKPYRSQMGSQ